MFQPGLLLAKVLRARKGCPIEVACVERSNEAQICGRRHFDEGLDEDEAFLHPWQNEKCIEIMYVYVYVYVYVYIYMHIYADT